MKSSYDLFVAEIIKKLNPFTTVRIGEFNVQTKKAKFWAYAGSGFYVKGDFREGMPVRHAFSSRKIRVPELYLYRIKSNKGKEYLFIARSNVL